MNKQSSGFTVIELIFITVLISIASVMFFIQKNNLETQANDKIRKTAINAMYYNLEEVFYPTNKYYPRTISADNLTAIDPALFTDSNGIKLGDTGGVYSYSPLNCNDDNKCTGYKLEASLDNEADFVRKSRNN